MREKRKITLTCLTFFLLLFLLTACGRKMDPTLEDYLSPEPLEKIDLMATYDKILITWSYPEKAKTKIESFLIERESKGEKKTLGYFSNETKSLEDKDFVFGETYKYRIFAIRPKGIYSKPTEATITPLRLPNVENLQYQISPQGLILSWTGYNSLKYNIYRINQKGEKIKIGLTDKNFFNDELTYSTINAFTNQNNYEMLYLITTHVLFENYYMEGKGVEISVPLRSFVPSKPQEFFWSVNEQGVYISWKEAPEKWLKGYKIYRKKLEEKDFKFIGETMIPLFLDAELNLSNLKSPVHYRIKAEGPVLESEFEEILIRGSTE